jgi:phytoene dehydrogenase-like protein
VRRTSWPNGFAVTVYERKAVFGGKARSLSVAGSGIGGRKTS